MRTEGFSAIALTGARNRATALWGASRGLIYFWPAVNAIDCFTFRRWGQEERIAVSPAKRSSAAGEFAAVE